MLAVGPWSLVTVLEAGSGWYLVSDTSLPLPQPGLLLPSLPDKCFQNWIHVGIQQPGRVEDTSAKVTHHCHHYLLFNNVQCTCFDCFY